MYKGEQTVRELRTELLQTGEGERKKKGTNNERTRLNRSTVLRATVVENFRKGIKSSVSRMLGMPYTTTTTTTIQRK